jgi:5'-3' exonuclease
LIALSAALSVKTAMGIRGLYSAIKSYAVPIHPAHEEPLVIGIDTYALFYKYKENLTDLFTFIQTLCCAKHTPIFIVDGVPPVEKQQELQLRKNQRKAAHSQAAALRAFLLEPSSQELDSRARAVLESKVLQYESESWAVYRELREEFVRLAKEKNYEVRFSQGEADADLLAMAFSNEIQVVLGNDMDYFVGGVERLWVLMKDTVELQEFRRSAVSKELGIHVDSWKDIAILSGYEKAPELRRVPASHAISLLRFYGSLEKVLLKRSELLRGSTVEEFLAARKFF